MNGRLAMAVAPPGAVFVTFQDFFLVFCRSSNPSHSLVHFSGQMRFEALCCTFSSQEEF